MATRFTPPPASSNQDSSVSAGSSRFIGRRFRSSLHEVSGVPGVTVAHDRFYELGRDRHVAWPTFPVEMCRDQLHAAHAVGIDELRETARRVQRMCKELENEILAGFRETLEASTATIPGASIEFAKEAGEAVVAVMQFREDPSDANAERVRREVVDVVQLGGSVLDLTTRRRSEVVRIVR
jgi:hypothetical protein